MNLRAAALTAEGARLGDTVIALPAPALQAARSAGPGEITLGIRPESAELAAADTAGALELTVALVEELGSDAYVYGTLAGDAPEDRPWVVRCDGRSAPRIGDVTGVSVRAAEAHLFDRHTGRRLD
jgi:multiple sugar transport system ATP-binding protein